MLFAASVERAILKKSEGKKIVAFDFFDTVMFRHIHSHQLLGQWSKAFKQKFPSLENIDLHSMRLQCIHDSGIDESEINYDVLISSIYEKIVHQNAGIAVPSKEEFVSTSYLLDFSIDLATQFPNREIVNIAQKLKTQGKCIVLITDYYLPGKCYEKYLNQYGLRSLFDKIYCSSDQGKSKYNGELYKYVLDELDMEPSNILMVGDSKRADYENALKCGMDAYRYFPLIHKLATNYRKYTKYSYQKHGARDVFYSSYNYTLFGEYSLNLYYFCRELLDMLQKRDIEKVSFLSRGGYFLQKCFDYYSYFKNKDTEIKSLYLKNSRKVNKKIEENADDAEILKRYLEPFSDNNKLCIVDEGWYCTSQITIQNKLGYETTGFYIGIMGRDKKNIACERKGILFDIDENGKESPLYGVFRTNCTFYEQLLSAPHGSTIGYEEVNGTINAVDDWKLTERKNYFENIESLQKIILEYIGGLSVWNCRLTKYELACCVLRTLLFASKEKLILEDKIIDSWYDNANDTTAKNFGRISDIKFNPIAAIVKPESYLRYFCKLKNLRLKYNFMNGIYPILGLVIYLMCRISIFIRYRDKEDL